jgi:hypothetical protein
MIPEEEELKVFDFDSVEVRKMKASLYHPVTSL